MNTTIKIGTIGFLLCFLALGTVRGQGFTSQVEGMWRAGNYAGVLAIAQQRLAADTNDLPGLLLKFEYESEYLLLAAATNTAAEILRVAPLIESASFAAVRSVVLDDAHCAMDLMPNYPPAEYATDLLKAGSITNKALACDYALQALEEDGYFQ